MTQYIDKSALVAEIDRIQNEFSDSPDRNGNFDELENQGAYKALSILESFLDTLKVKEVNLEKELGKYLDGNDIEFSHQIKLLDFAKHFFELGLKAKKGE